MAGQKMRELGIFTNYNLHLLSVDDINQAVEKFKAEFGARYDAISKVSPAEASFENTIRPLIEITRDMSNASTVVELPKNVVTDKQLRDASVAGSKEVDLFQVEMAMNKAVFDNVSAFAEKSGLKGLTAEQARFVEKAIVAGRRNGLHLDKEKQEEVKAVKKRISELGTQFSSNLNEDTTCLYFAPDELAGVPDDLVKSFEKNEAGKCKVTMQYPHIFPVTRKCRNPETRRRMEAAFQSRCKDSNTAILEQLVELRQRQAELLGYADHASYVHELRMAKSPAAVAGFLAGLAARLQPLWAAEREEMLGLKKAECERLGLEFDGRINFWDVRYYCTLIEEQKFSVDQETLKQYFPLAKVKDGLLRIYQQLLGLTFDEVEGADKWHEDVSLFSVTDNSTKEVLGYFFLDLHPRDGKYGHACIIPLQIACNGPNDKYQPSVCVMLANFSKATETKPALLDHDEVETFFHEFGHVMHNICARPETAQFSLNGVERDFIEAPSQMLENWVWDEESLRIMSGHYEDDSPIPKDILDKLVASRKANAGAFNLRQIILGTFDQRIHTTGKADTQQIFAKTYEEILGISPIPDTNMPATFGHMVGYDAQYYGYMWSEVYSFDMFETRFKAEGLLDPKVGLDYRNCILKPGSTRDASDLLRDFLGREPNDEAFLRSKGLVK